MKDFMRSQVHFNMLEWVAGQCYLAGGGEATTKVSLFFQWSNYMKDMTEDIFVDLAKSRETHKQMYFRALRVRQKFI